MTDVNPQPYPQDDPDGWQVTIGPVEVSERTCKVTLEGLTTGVRLDKKPAAGRNGATITYQGDDLASFSIRLESWNRAGWAILMAICGMARKARGEPLSVFHPMLDAAGVSRLIVEKVKWPGNDSTALQTATLECTEWAPRPKAAKVVTKTPGTDRTPDALSIHKSGGRDFKLPAAATPVAPWKSTPKP